MNQKQQMDFRIKIFHILCKTFKALKLFLLQKTVRKIKLKKAENQPITDLDENLNILKQIKGNDARRIAYHYMKKKLNLDLSPQAVFFQKQVPEVEKQIMEDEQPYKLFLASISGTKKLTTSMAEINSLMQYVDRKMNKTKLNRIKKQEKTQTKKQLKAEGVDIDIKKPQKVAKSPAPQVKKIRKVVQAPPRTVFDFKRRRNEKENKKEPTRNIQYQYHQDETPAPDFSFKTLHPSWQAKIELKQMAGNFEVFEGKKIKLC